MADPPGIAWSKGTRPTFHSKAVPDGFEARLPEPIFKPPLIKTKTNRLLAVLFAERVQKGFLGHDAPRLTQLNDRSR